VKVVTICSWLNFGGPAPPGRGLRRGGKFWLCLTTAIADSVRLWGTVAGAQWALFHSFLELEVGKNHVEWECGGSWNKTRKLEALGQRKPAPRQRILQNPNNNPYPVVVKIPSNSRIRIVIRIVTEIQSFVAGQTFHHSQEKILSKFVDNFLSYPANRQRDESKNITSLEQEAIKQECDYRKQREQ